MKIDLVIGVDPGVTGAWAFRTEHAIEVRDMPTELSPSGKTRVSPAGVAALIGEFVHGDDLGAIAVVERAQASQDSGVSSMFSYGAGYGTLLGVLAAYRVPVYLVGSAQWKPAMGIKGGAGFGQGAPDKGPAIAAAREMFPSLAVEVCKPKHSGRAEAALLTAYAQAPLMKAGILPPAWLRTQLRVTPQPATPSVPGGVLPTALGDVEF